MKSVHQLLVDNRWKIERRFTQGAFRRRREDDGEMLYCMAGALGGGTSSKPKNYTTAIMQIERAITQLNPGRFADVAQFNDTHTRNQCLEVWDLAIENTRPR